MKAWIFVIIMTVFQSCNSDHYAPRSSEARGNPAPDFPAWYQGEAIARGDTTAPQPAPVQVKPAKVDNSPILTGKRGGRYQIVTAKDGHQYKRYLKK